MDEENLENNSVSKIQNDSATDVTDAQAEKNFSDSAVSNNYLKSPCPSLENIPAGEALHQYSPRIRNVPDISSISTKFKTGADVLNNFQPKTPKYDLEGSWSEVFSDLDASNDSTFQFTVEGASDAVKYYFPEYKNDLKSKNDEIDASPNDANPNDVEIPMSTSYKGELNITTDQSCDASSKKERRENQFRYNMNHRSRGCFVIFNQEIFDLYNHLRHPDLHLGKRTGTKADSANLEHMAKQLGFEFIRTIYDATRQEITDMITTLATANHTDYDCFGCAILTHGGDRDILFARDAEMKLSEFTRPFGADVCPTLAGKPKLFFIQACRGSQLDPGGSLVMKICVDHVDGGGGGPGKSEDEVDAGSANFYTIPAGADYLIANSTMPEHYSFRNQANGSIFVQNICAVFNNFGDSLELMQLMTRVNRMMAYDFESSTNVAKYHGKKQIPSIATRLTAEVYFPPKKTFCEDYNNISSKSKMEVDGTPRTKSTNRSDRVDQGSQAASLREARYETKQKSFYPQQPSKTDEAFTPSTTAVQVSTPKQGRYETEHFYPQQPSKKDEVFTPSTTAAQVSPPDQGYRDRLEIPRVNTGVPIRGRSSTITIPHRIKSEEDTGPTWSTSRFHKSPTEPVSIEQLRKERGKRVNANRHSFPELKRLVKQDTDNVLLVGGKKTNVQYEESDI